MLAKKIFISVGSRFSMDRLISTVDEFIDRNSGYQATAQFGNSNKSFKHIKTIAWLTPDEFSASLADCDIFISHAGMGNILLALEHKKPIIVMARKAKNGEHINDHQSGTIEGLQEQNLVHIIGNVNDLEAIIESIDESNNVNTNQPNTYKKRDQLIGFLDNFLNQQ